MIVHLIDGTRAGGGESVAALLSRSGGRLLAMSPVHPDIRFQISTLGIPDDEQLSPGRRISALEKRVCRLRRLRVRAIAAHDDSSHEAAALSAVSGGPPVVRVVHTTAIDRPDEHRHAMRVLRSATSLYFCSDPDSVRRARALGLAALRLPQPIDLRRLGPPAIGSRASRRPADAAIQLLYVGRLDQWKGVDVLLDSLAMARSRRPVRLIILGDGVERPSLDARARSLGLEHRVSFLGRRSDREVIQRYRSADLVIIPSRFESIPLVMLEAMAVGVPVAAMAVGGIPMILDRGKFGTLIKPGSPRHLAKAIEQFAADPGPFCAAAAKALPVIRRQHDATRVAAWVAEQICRKIFAKPRRNDMKRTA